MDSPLEHFADLRDPREERTREHLLEEILLIAIAAVLSGANGWNEIEDYAHSKHAWFKSFLTLPSGIPSHDTLNRVFSALDPEELEKGFVAWVSSIAKLTAGEVVAIDGKTLRGASEPNKKGPDKKAMKIPAENRAMAEIFHTLKAGSNGAQGQVLPMCATLRLSTLATSFDTAS